MKRMVLTGLIAMVAMASPTIASVAIAQQPEMVLAFLDKTGDGKCDLNEYLTYQATRIAQVDKDGDGELNQAEFKESLQGKSKQSAAILFKSSNAEGGRTLTQREFLGYQAWVFKTFVDTDKDGFMSAEEWTAIMALAG